VQLIDPQGYLRRGHGVLDEVDLNQNACAVRQPSDAFRFYRFQPKMVEVAADNVPDDQTGQLVASRIRAPNDLAPIGQEVDHAKYRPKNHAK
jgi:hypothetical protein